MQKTEYLYYYSYNMQLISASISEDKIKVNE